MGLVPEGKSPQIQYVRPHHRAMARAMACGARPVELCQMFGYSAGQISRIINSPLFQAEVGRMEAQAEHEAVGVNRDLQEVAKEAVVFLSAEMERDGDALSERQHKRQVAFGVLDRAGYAKRETPQLHLHKHEHEHSAREMDTEDLYREVIDLAEDEVEGG